MAAPEPPEAPTYLSPRWSTSPLSVRASILALTDYLDRWAAAMRPRERSLRFWMERAETVDGECVTISIPLRDIEALARHLETSIERAELFSQIIAGAYERREARAARKAAKAAAGAPDERTSEQ